MDIYLAQQNSQGRVKFISLHLEDNQIHKTWGLIDGKTQTKVSTYKAKNVGKSNQITSQQSAKAEIDRIVKQKTKEGYIIVKSLDQAKKFIDPFESLDLDNIHTGFCCSKPHQKIEPDKIDKLIKSGSSKAFVKYNGGCHYISINSNNDIRIFTRRWDDHTAKYPFVVEAVMRSTLPKNTLIIAEFCVNPLQGIDHMGAFKILSKISKSDTHKGQCKPDQRVSIDLQKQYKVKAAVFGILYLNGEQLWHLPYKDQWASIERRFRPLNKKDILFRPQQIEAPNGTSMSLMLANHKKRIEGAVIWDMNQAMEVTMNGKPARRACWKIKARGEMDVIAYDGEEGKVPGEYGSLKIGRYNKDKTFIEMGTVSGLKEQEKKPSYWVFPCVIEVTYDNIFPDTGKLQFGNFSKIHEDKQLDEVDLFGSN